MTEDWYGVVLKMQDKMEYLVKSYEEDAKDVEQSGDKYSAVFCAGKAYGVEVVLTYLQSLKHEVQHAD